MNKYLIAYLVAGLFAIPAHAEDQQQTQATAPEQPAQQSDQSNSPPVPPTSNLGKQVSGGPLQVVYPRAEDVIREAVEDIHNGQLTPEQVKQLKLIWLQMEEQKAMPYGDPAKPVTRTLPLNLDPGVSPPVMRLSMGQQTSVVFSDYSGQPWMIQNVSMNRTSFDDGKAGAQGGQAAPNTAPTNILTISPTGPKAYGNVTVTLKGLSTPIILMLTTGQQEVDMRVDAKVPGRNPDAAATVNMLTMPQIDGDLTYFLDGVPPKEAGRLKVTGMAGVDAWLYKNDLYVRAKADAQYPAYTNAARSTSGTAVYRYAGMQNSITFTTGGQAVTVFIEQGDIQ
ncbi:DotH/IcmK family type IV secretion protein [Pseudomonas amygdali]|uniref:DotH/IcmK family type IV secretion protein n=1 Tax=Pseudomonas amygdali TaxID=47877 RepID=UPI0006E702E5|nr:DotH/IcmK family type IV secretion protein [Pseudomonas amygdali]KPY55710.1 hypothetical protein ALO93_200245 [Pseudomonas amygdali pv. sesami]